VPRASNDAVALRWQRGEMVSRISHDMVVIRCDFFLGDAAVRVSDSSGNWRDGLQPSIDAQGCSIGRSRIEAIGALDLESAGVPFAAVYSLTTLEVQRVEMW
jgi:hypothetical protein